MANDFESLCLPGLSSLLATHIPRDNQSIQSEYAVAIFVSLSNVTTPEEEAAVRRLIVNFQSRLPGDRCPSATIIENLTPDFAMIEYFNVKVYKPQVHAITVSTCIGFVRVGSLCSPTQWSSLHLSKRI
jgi:hypothetical protein